MEKSRRFFSDTLSSTVMTSPSSSSSSSSSCLPHYRPHSVILPIRSDVIMFLFIIFSPFLSSGAKNVGQELCHASSSSSSSSSTHHVTSEKLNLPLATLGRLLEIHVRQSIEGDLLVTSSSSSSSSSSQQQQGSLEVNVDKISSSEFPESGFVNNHTLYDAGRGTILTLEIDYRVKDGGQFMALVLWMVLVTMATLVLVLLFVCAFLRTKRKVRGGAKEQSSSGMNEEARDEGPIAEGSNQCPFAANSGELLNLSANPVVTSSSPMATRPVTSSGHPPPPPPPPSVRSTGGGHVLTQFSTLNSSLTLLALTTCLISVVMTTCPIDPPAAMVTLVLPISLKLDAIKFYLKDGSKNQVRTDGWIHENVTDVQIYAVSETNHWKNQDAPVVPPCTPNEVNCRPAIIQGLAGCNPWTGDCICQRGYNLIEGVCTDVNECLEGSNRCPSSSTCRNLIGSYRCDCGSGYYEMDRQCHECSTLCPSGWFESKPCTPFNDRVCTECKECMITEYEFTPCTKDFDRLCIHAAHPATTSGQKLRSVSVEGLKFESSSNVFHDDLHTSRNLETTNYVTDVTHSLDFSWERDSGLKIKVGVNKVKVIPRYEDDEGRGRGPEAGAQTRAGSKRDRPGENYYVTKKPNNSEADKFKLITDAYCRYPVPDYYSLTLEITRDRTTNSSVITCDSRNPRIPPCPPPFSDGDKFLFRSLNEACYKQGTFPEVLGAFPNAFVTTEFSPLLKEIFGQTYAKVVPITFPSEWCKAASSRCSQCLKQPRCLTLDIFQKRCCQIDCYTLHDCRLSISSECRLIPVECSMGDAYTYTLQPTYQNIGQEFQCYLRLSQQRILYDLYYYIEIPSVGFESQKIYRTVEVKDIKQRTKGHFKADFLTVEHNTGLDLENEFLLVGRKVKGEEHRNFTLHTFPPLAEYATSSPYFHLISGARRPTAPGRPGTTVAGEKLHVHTVSPNIFVANLQFERPFDFSTSTWSLEAASSRGILDKIRPVKPRFGQSKEQPVTVRMQYSDGRYAYYPKSLDNPPYLRFSVPGNASILPVFFKTGTGRLVTGDGEFKVTLDLVNHNRVWEVFVAGSVTDCPAYLGVTLNCHQEAEELVNFDLLISCPKQFNVTFKLPNWSPQLEKNFELILKDSMESHVFHLTHFTLETDEKEGSRSDNELKRPPSMLHYHNHHNHSRPLQANKVQILTSGYSLLTVTVAILCGCFLAFLATFIFAYFFKDALSVVRGTKNRSQSSEAVVAFVDAHSDTCVDDERLFATSARLCGCFCCRCGNFGDVYGRSNLSKSSRIKRRFVLFCFVVFCVSYSTFFTFTSSYLILSALNSVEWTELKAKLIVLKLEIENITGADSRPGFDFSAFTDGTVKMSRMMSACSAYADQLFLEAAKNSSKISRSKHEKIFSVSILRSSKERTAKTSRGPNEAGHHNPDNLPLYKRIMSIHSAIERELRIHGAERFSNLSKRLDDLVKDSVESFAPGVKSALSSYARFLGDVASSRWFSFPLQVFQQQQHPSASKSILGVRGFSYHSGDSELESPQNQLFDNFSVSSSYNVLEEKLFKESCLEILKSVDFEFGKFLEIEEVDFVKIWLQRFWHKFETNLPKLPDFDKELFLNPTLVGESDRTECPLECSDTSDCGRDSIDFNSYPDVIRYHTMSEPPIGPQIHGSDPSVPGFLKKRSFRVDVYKNWSEIGENGRHFPSKNLSDFKKRAKIKRKIISDRKPNGRARKSISLSEEKSNSFIQPALLSPTPKPLSMDTLPQPVASHPALGQNSSACPPNNTCDTVVKIQRAAPQFERLSDAAEVDADVVDYRSDFHAFCGWTTYVFVSLDVILITYRLAILLCKLHSYHRIFFRDKTNCQLESKEGREYYQVEVPLNTPETLMYSTLPGPQSCHHRATNSAGSTPERLPLDHLRTRSKSVDQFYQQCCQHVLRSQDQPFHEFSSTSIKTSGSYSSNPALRTAVGSHQTFEQNAVKCDSYRQTSLQLSIEPRIAWYSCPLFLCCFLAAPFERPSRPRGHHGPPKGVKFSSVLMEILAGGTASKIFMAAGLAAMIFVTTTSLLDRLLDPTLADELSIGSLAATSQAEQLEAYSEEEAKYLNNHLAEVYRRQMAEELVMIANFVDFFNEDQRQMVKSFKKELCLIKRVMLSPLKVTCPGVEDDDDDDDYDNDDDDKEDDLEELLRLLVLPCNFLPVKREKLESEKLINSQRLLFSNVLSPLTGAITSIIIKTSLFFIISIFIYISVAVLTCHCTLSFAYKQLHSPGLCHRYTCTHPRHQRQLLTSQSPNFRDRCEVRRSTSSPYFGGCTEVARSSTLPSKCVQAGSPTARKTTKDTYQQQQQQQQHQQQQQQQQECPRNSTSPPFHHHHQHRHHQHHPLPHHHHHHHQQQQQHCHQEGQIQDHPKYSETKV